MSAQESQIASLQGMLHEQNQIRFRAIEENQREQQEMLQTILWNTNGMKDLKTDVDDLKASHNRLKGGVKVAGAIGGGAVTAWEIIRSIFKL